MITFAFARRIPHSHLLLAATLLPLISHANAQEKITDVLLPSSCERVLPIAMQTFEQRALPLHRSAACPGCFEASTTQLHDASGTPVSATTAYKRYVDRKFFPSSNIFRWYTEREFRAVAHLRAEQNETSCRVGLVFDFDFYGIELIAGLPIDGDRIRGKSNLRLESEYLNYLQKLIPPASSH